MALFQRKINESSVQPLYSIGANKSVLVIGLGNPGSEYESTRHNMGFRAVSYFADNNSFPGWVSKKDLKSQLCISTIADTRVILCKPATFMNTSGEAVASVQRFYRIYNQNTLVVYDELGVDFGHIRTRQSGSDGGHNGVKSIIDHIGDDFGRIRIGINNDSAQKIKSEDFVLGNLTKAEAGKLLPITREVNSLILEYISEGKLEPKTIKID